MAPNDRKGVWKSGKGKGRHTPKGRQLDDQAWDDVKALLGAGPHPRDMLIENLHKIQDKFGCLSAAHIRALADFGSYTQAPARRVNLRPQIAIYGVNGFGRIAYHHIEPLI